MNFYLSHSRSDEHIKLRITSALEKVGHIVTSTLYGVSMADYDRAMDTQIRSVLAADAVIVLLSPDAVRDENLEMDFQIALRGAIRIWPVIVSGDISMEHYPLPRLLRGIGGVYCDLREFPYNIVEILSLFFVYTGLSLDDNSDAEREWYDLAINIQPDNAKAYHLRGNVYEKQGSHQKALDDFSTTIRLNPFIPQAYANRARLYRMRREYPLALADCEAALHLDPKHRMAYIIRGNIEVKLEQYVQAVQDFDVALTLDAQDALSYANRGHARCLLGQLEAALADCNRALMLDPQCWMARLFRGEVYQIQIEQKKRVEKTDLLLDLALVDFNAVLSIDHHDTAYYGRAKIRYWKGDRQGAVADCQMALTLNSQHSAADRMRAFIEHEGKSHL